MGDISKKGAKKTRRSQKRSREGCLTCRKRHRKCDERHPRCLLCAIEGIHCEGYPARFVWKNYTPPISGTGISHPIDAVHNLDQEGTLVPFKETVDVTSLLSSNATNEMESDQITWPFTSKDVIPVRAASIERLLSHVCLSTEAYNSTVTHSSEPRMGESAEASPDLARTRLPLSPTSVSDGTNSQPITIGTEPYVIVEDPDLASSVDESMFEESNLLQGVTKPLFSGSQRLFKPMNCATCMTLNPSGLLNFEYFVARLPIIAIAFDDLSQNPYRSLVLPLCFQYENVLNAVLSIAALHRWKSGLADISEAFIYKEKALSFWPNQQLNSCERDVLALVKFIVLLVFDIYHNGCTQKTLKELEVCLVSFGNSSVAEYGSGMICKGFHGASILAATMRAQEFPLPEEYPSACTPPSSIEMIDVNSQIVPSSSPADFSTMSPNPVSFEQLWGCHEDVFRFISSITDFSLVLRQRNMDVRTGLISCPRLFADAQRLEWTMIHWEPSSQLRSNSTAREISIKSSCIFRDASLLYFYRVIMDKDNSDTQVQSTVARIVVSLEQIPSDDHINTCLIWPLFITGCELLDGALRAAVVQRLELILNACRNGAAYKAIQILKLVWHQCDGNNGQVTDRVDWLTVAGYYGGMELCLF